MQHEWYARLPQKKKDWFSKLTDGVLASLILVLLWLTILLGIRPISLRYGPPGLLVYVIGLLAISMFAFQHSLLPRHGETVRAWYGMAGGFLAWSVVEMVAYLGVPMLPNLAGVGIFILVALIVTILWRYGLPMGARFFAATFMLNWVGMVFMHYQGKLAELSPIFSLTYRATGYLAMVAVIFVLVWILAQSRRRIHRLTGALIIWFLVSLALYTFRGSLF